MDTPQLQPYVEGTAGDVIKPYLTEDGKHFARDFWMVDRLGAQMGALVDDYQMALVIMGGPVGSLSAIGAHNAVVGPDDPSVAWNGVMTSPGTIGWNPWGATYRYNPLLTESENRHAWILSGCPKSNAYGQWNGGLPQAYVDESWRGVNERDLSQPGFPGTGKGGRGRSRWR